MLVLKDVLRPSLKPISSGGGKSSNQTSTLQTATSFMYLEIVNLYQWHEITFDRIPIE